MRVCTGKYTSVICNRYIMNMKIKYGLPKDIPHQKQTSNIETEVFAGQLTTYGVIHKSHAVHVQASSNTHLFTIFRDTGALNQPQYSEVVLSLVTLLKP